MSNVENLIANELYKIAKKKIDSANSEEGVTYESKASIKKEDFKEQARGIAKALNPILIQLEALTAAVEAMNEAIGPAINATGAGAASAGALGAAAYKVNQTKILKTTTEVKKELKKLKS